MLVKGVFNNEDVVGRKCLLFILVFLDGMVV